MMWRTSFLVAAGLAFCACSDSSTPAARDDDKFDVMVVTPVTTPDLYDVMHAPASGEFVGALVDITNHTCEKTTEGWEVTGTATNPTDAPVGYRIYISLINGTAATRALVEAEVADVPAGGSGSFDTVIELPDNDLRCVLRVERRAAGG